jgi:hypothetical protein
MTKKLAIPEGNLLRVVAKKGITTLSALKEKTSVDRKTLRAINKGQPVKETTLQKRSRTNCAFRWTTFSVRALSTRSKTAAASLPTIE